jgi:hypothetical protein
MIKTVKKKQYRTQRPKHDGSRWYWSGQIFSIRTWRKGVREPHRCLRTEHATKRKQMQGPWGSMHLSNLSKQQGKEVKMVSDWSKQNKSKSGREIRKWKGRQITKGFIDQTKDHGFIANYLGATGLCWQRNNVIRFQYCLWIMPATGWRIRKLE